jgi:hypothetical protein
VWDGGCGVGWCVGWGGVGVGVVCVGRGSPLALEHSKVCTLCDFGHLQFILLFYFIYFNLGLKSVFY